MQEALALSIFIRYTTTCTVSLNIKTTYSNVSIMSFIHRRTKDIVFNLLVFHYVKVCFLFTLNLQRFKYGKTPMRFHSHLTEVLLIDM